MLFLAARRAGFPVRRTTAERMFYGDAGWFGYLVRYGEKQVLDLVWWTFKPSRPYGHVGVMWGEHESVAHASSSAGSVTVSRLVGGMRTNISGIKRLGYGE